MYLNSLACSVPDTAYSQHECWDILVRSAAFDRLKSRSQSILEKVLTGDSGIARRHFAIADIETVFTRDAGSLNRTFEHEAPRLGEAALRQALQSTAMNAATLDALIVCTCTGYLCPGISSYLAELLGLPDNTYLQDLVGLGCGAAIPALRTADHFLAAHPDATVAVVAVEICSAAFYLDDDPGVLISLCLFADGAAASIWSNDAAAGLGLRATGFDTLHQPEHRELLRFENTRGKLRNKLHKSVPERAADAVDTLYRRQVAGAPQAPVLAHAGGREVIRALEHRLDKGELTESREILRKYGNMSSPSVLFALEERLRTRQADPDDTLWLTSFGAGFSAHGFSLSRHPA